MLSGEGLPAPGLGALNDHYIDLETDNLFQKLAGGWTLIGNLATPGATMNGWMWFSIIYPTATGNTVTNEVFAADRSEVTIHVTGATDDGGGGGLGWHFTDPPSPVNLAGYSALRFNLNLTIASGTVDEMTLTVGENGMWGCYYVFSVTPGSHPVSVGLRSAPDNCWSNPGFDMPDPTTFHPSSVDTVTIELPYDESAVERIVTMSVSDMELVW